MCWSNRRWLLKTGELLILAMKTAFCTRQLQFGKTQRVRIVSWLVGRVCPCCLAKHLLATEEDMAFKDVPSTEAAAPLRRGLQFQGKVIRFQGRNFIVD